MIFQSIAKKVIINRLQKSITKAVGLDKATKKQLKKLNGHLFLVECTQPKLNVYLQIEKGLPKLFMATAAEKLPVPNTILQGKASDFLQLAQSETPQAAIAQEGLSLRGDYQAFETLFEIVHNLELDFESPLANILGDVPAHTIGKTLRQANKSRKNVQEQLKKHTSDYLNKDDQLSPTQEEVENFSEGVRHLKQDVERLDAKLKKIKNQLDEK